jgi:hypothetical protein
MAVAPGDPYASVSRLSWPRNVLLSGTIIEGSATVPLPASIWSSTTLIQVSDATTSLADNGGNETAHINSEIELKTWQGWREQQVPMKLSKDVSSIEDLVGDDFRVPASIFRQCQRIFATAYTWCGADKALKYTAKGCLVPYGVTSEQDGALAHTVDVAKLDDDELDSIRQVLA